MAYPQFSYYHPRSPATLKTVDFDSVALQWSLFERQQSVDRALTLTEGRRAVSVVHGAYDAMEIEFGPFDPDHEPAFFEQVWAWSSYAMAGGVFAVTFDSALKTSAALTSATAVTDTTIAVPSTGFASPQKVLFVDVDDEWQRAIGVISSVPGGSSIVLARAIGFIFNNGSTMRHIEYFPACVLQEVKAPFKERKADDGPGWMFKGTIETVKP